MLRLLTVVTALALLPFGAARAELPREGSQVPWIAAFDLNGAPVNIGRVLTRKTNVDGKIVPARGAVVQFWATWCKACLLEMQQLRDNRDRLRQAGIEVLLVNVLEDQEKVVAKMTELKMMDLFSSVRDATGSVAELVGIVPPGGASAAGPDIKLPFSMIVARRGQTVKKVLTAGSPNHVDEIVAALADEPSL